MDRTEGVWRVKGRKDVPEGLGSFWLKGAVRCVVGPFSEMGQMGRSRFGRETQASCSGFCPVYLPHPPSATAGLLLHSSLAPWSY